MTWSCICVVFSLYFKIFLQVKCPLKLLIVSLLRGSELCVETFQDFFSFDYMLILILSTILIHVTNQKVEKSQRSSDLLNDIYNCMQTSFIANILTFPADFKINKKSL